MKKFLRLSIALLLVTAVACTDEDNPGESSKQKTPVFSVGKLPELDPAVSLPAGGSVKLKIQWSEAWTAESSEDWLTVSPSKGNPGSVELVITSKENTDAQGRSAVLTISSESESKSLTISQNPNIYDRVFLKSRRIVHEFSWIFGPGARMGESVLAIPYPESNEYQVVKDRVIECGEMQVSKEGVKYLYDHRTQGFPASGEPYIKQTYTVDFYYTKVDFSRITERSLPYNTESAEYKRYTDRAKDSDGTYMIDPGDYRIKEYAKGLWAQSNGDRIEYARLCYEWVASNLKYGIYDEGNDINGILSRMSGDCGNQHAVWLSLMRNAGIPARPIVMNSPNPDGFTHVRGEFYMPGYGWIPVDATYHQGDHDTDYFGAYTDDNLVVMNRDFSFTIVKDFKTTYLCGLLQGVFCLIGGSGEFDGAEKFEICD